MSDKAVTQYLHRYAESECTFIQEWPEQLSYQHVVLVPAYQENDFFLQHALASKWFNADVLIILIINQPEHAEDSGMQQTLHLQTMASGRVLWQQQHLSLLAIIAIDSETDTKGHILLIDRFSKPLPRKQGVGLARKIAADIALKLISKGYIRSQWIASTDADAQLPHNYFSVQNKIPANAIAAYYEFNHIDGDPKVLNATKIYEQALRYYVTGLNYAGSPYAHHSIGSTLVFRADSYAKVRGFPKRAAGEDFYLLNKLAKLGKVHAISEATVLLKARISNRVPFGTGASTAKILELQKAGKHFFYYHPQCFVELRQVILQFNNLWNHQDKLETWLKQLTKHSSALLLQAGIKTFVAKQGPLCKTKTQFDAQLMRWFDALKTLQFIHGIRDCCYPDVMLSEVEKMTPFKL